MVDLNKINFMSKSRFDNLSSINQDELYAVKSEVADKDWVFSYFSDMLDTIFPVGSVYIGTMNICPIASLIPGSVWEKVSEGRVLEGSDSTHTAGSTAEAGLPNITGSVGSICHYGNAGGTDALSITAQTNDLNLSGSSQWGGSSLSIDASDSNSIYGNSDTVQPPAYFVNIWKRTS